jgi:hypothetical protein
MPKDITLDEIRRMAADAGLTRLADEQLKELMRATQAAKQRTSALPTSDLTLADEPAHVYTLLREAQR